MCIQNAEAQRIGKTASELVFKNVVFIIGGGLSIRDIDIKYITNYPATIIAVNSSGYYLPRYDYSFTADFTNIENRFKRLKNPILAIYDTYTGWLPAKYHYIKSIDLHRLPEGYVHFGNSGLAAFEMVLLHPEVQFIFLFGIDFNNWTEHWYNNIHQGKATCHKSRALKRWNNLNTSKTVYNISPNSKVTKYPRLDWFTCKILLENLRCSLPYPQYYQEYGLL